MKSTLQKKSHAWRNTKAAKGLGEKLMSDQNNKCANPLCEIPITLSWSWEAYEQNYEDTEELKIATFDHIKPLSKGGTDEWDNFQLLCRSCNSRKGNRYGQ